MDRAVAEKVLRLAKGIVSAREEYLRSKEVEAVQAGPSREAVLLAKELRLLKGIVSTLEEHVRGPDTVTTASSRPNRTASQELPRPV